MLENGGKGQGFEEEGKGQCLCAEVDGQELEAVFSSFSTFRCRHSLLLILGWVGVGIFAAFTKLKWDKCT